MKSVHKPSALLLPASALAIGACLVAYSTPAHAGERVGQIRLQSGLPAEQVSLLRRDRAVFNRMKLSAQHSAGLKALLEVGSLAPATLNRWLEDRVQVVVGDEFDADEHLVVVKTGVDYENPGLFGTQEQSPLKPSGQKGITIMSNTGEWLYRRAKRRSELWAVSVPGVGVVPAASPRSGIIQVGPGLFGRSYQVNRSDTRAMSNSIPRLSTFFHEARHSDGSGENLGFHHAVCPEGHDMAGYHACDRNLNGPYTIGAAIVKALARACTECTASEREALKLMTLEKYSRVLTHELDGKTPVRALSTRPEGKRLPIVKFGRPWLVKSLALE